MSDVAQSTAPEAPTVEGSARVVRIRVRSVDSAIAYLLIAAVVIWRTWAAMRWSFQGDDWRLVPEALRMPFFSYVFRQYHGHLQPGQFSLMWLTTRAAPYNYAVAMAPLLLITAFGGVLMWRFLRALFGESPLNLIPLAVFMLCPLSLRAAFWWTAGWTLIPLQVFVVAALFATLLYVRSPSTRRLLIAGAVYAGALLFWEKAVLILPLAVLFAVLFLGEGSGWSRVKGVLVGRWRVWIAMGALTVPYLVWYFSVANLTSQDSTLGQIRGLARIAVGSTVLPGYLGGPWSAPLPSAGKAPVYVLHGLGSFFTWVAFALLVGVTVVLWRQAWRAWAMLLAYVGMCIGLIAFGRLGIIGPGIGLDTRYFADSVPVFAIAVALAFMAPLERRGDPAWGRRIVVIDVGSGHDDEEAAPRPRHRRAGPKWITRNPRTVPILVIAAYAVSALITGYRTANLADRYSVKPWFANVRVALATHPGASIYDDYLPKDALPAVLDPLAAKMSFSLGPLAPSVRWNIPSERMLAFDGEGRLVPARLAPSAFVRPGPVPDCGYLVYSRPVALPLKLPLGLRTWGVFVRYLTNSNVQGWVDVDGQRVFVPFHRGAHSMLLIHRGTVSTVTIWGGGAHVCVGAVWVGTVRPATTGSVSSPGATPGSPTPSPPRSTS